jgi:uncharacterized protein (DUF2141 family)
MDFTAGTFLCSAPETRTFTLLQDSTMRTLAIIAAVLLVPLAVYGEDVTPAHGALELNVTNIENGSGTLYIAILDSPDGWLKSDSESKPFRDVTQAVYSTDDLLIKIEGLPPGKYAISLFQDLDGDAEMDTNFIGFPKEPFGFSAPMGKFGPPKFEKATVEFSGEDTSIDILLN